MAKLSEAEKDYSIAGPMSLHEVQEHLQTAVNAMGKAIDALHQAADESDGYEERMLNQQSAEFVDAIGITQARAAAIGMTIFQPALKIDSSII